MEGNCRSEWSFLSLIPISLTLGHTPSDAMLGWLVLTLNMTHMKVQDTAWHPNTQM